MFFNKKAHNLILRVFLRRHFGGKVGCLFLTIFIFFDFLIFFIFQDSSFWPPCSIFFFRSAAFVKLKFGWQRIFSQPKSKKRRLPSRKLTCPPKWHHFKRKFHLPTINFEGICYIVFRGLLPLPETVRT